MVGGGTVVLLEDITERRNSEARISHMARFDELTGLPNRVSFRERNRPHAEAARTNPRCRPCCSSISISSSRSTIRLVIHAAISCCAWSPIGCAKCCARMTSWLVLAVTNLSCSNVPSRQIDDAADLARRIVERLSERYEVDNHQVEIGASVGIAMTERRCQR